MGGGWLCGSSVNHLVFLYEKGTQARTRGKRVFTNRVFQLFFNEKFHRSSYSLIMLALTFLANEEETTLQVSVTDRSDSDAIGPLICDFGDYFNVLVPHHPLCMILVLSSMFWKNLSKTLEK